MVSWEKVTPVVRTSTGGYVAVSEVWQRSASGWIAVTDVYDNVDTTGGPVTPPPTGGTVKFGGYWGPPGQSPNPVTTYQTSIGETPESTLIYVTTQSGASLASIKTRLVQWLQLGMTVAVDFDPKDSVDGIIYNTSLGDTSYVDPLITMCQEAMATSGVAAAGGQVICAWCHEWEIKSRQSRTGVVTPPIFADSRDWDVPTFAKSHDVVTRRVRQNAPLCKMAYWTGSFDSAVIKQTMGLLTAAPDFYLSDNYVSSGNTFATAASDLGAWLSIVKGWPEYVALGRPKPGFGEYGVDLSAHGDANGARYFQGLRSWFVANDVGFASLFNRNKTDADGRTVFYEIDTLNADGSYRYPATLAAFRTEALAA